MFGHWIARQPHSRPRCEGVLVEHSLRDRLPIHLADGTQLWFTRSHERNWPCPRRCRSIGVTTRYCTNRSKSRRLRKRSARRRAELKEQRQVARVHPRPRAPCRARGFAMVALKVFARSSLSPGPYGRRKRPGYPPLAADPGALSSTIVTMHARESGHRRRTPGWNRSTSRSA